MRGPPLDAQQTKSKRNCPRCHNSRQRFPSAGFTWNINLPRKKKRGGGVSHLRDVLSKEDIQDEVGKDHGNLCEYVWKYSNNKNKYETSRYFLFGIAFIPSTPPYFQEPLMPNFG